MKKIYMILAAITLLSMSLNAQMTLTKAPSRANRATTVTFDFTTNNWGIPTGSSNNITQGTNTYSNGEYTITLTSNSGSGYTNHGYYYNSSGNYLMMCRSSARLILPAFDQVVNKIEVICTSGTSGSAYQNIFLGSTNTTVSTETKSQGTHEYVIDSDYKDVGTVYSLKQTANYNAQVQKVIVYFESGNPELTVPTSLNVGTNTGSGVSNTFNLSGSNLTQALSLSVTAGTGFSVSPTTISAADAMAGTTVTVTYNGSATNATGTLTISSNEVSATVDLTASYSAPNIYEKVTSESQLRAGKQYILVYEGGPAVMGAITTSGTLYGTSVSGATLSGNEIDVAGATGVSELTLGGQSGAWTFTADGTNYLNYTGSSNTLSTSTDNTANDAKWTATSSNGGYILTNVGSSSRVLQYNTSYTRFACYTGGQQDAFLYVKKSTTAELTSIANGDIIPVGTNTGNGVSKTVNIKGNNLTQDLTVNVSGNGFSISRAVTVTAAEANSANGQDVIVTYDGTDANATGTLTVQSSEIGTVTAQLTASYNGGSTPGGNEVTVCDGSATNEYLPVYGYYFDADQTNQMIYPASMFTNSGMDNKTITSITFYPTTYTDGSGYYATTYSGINFYRNSNDGGTVTLKLANMPSGTTGYTADDPERKVPADGFTTVKTITMPTSAQTDLTEWVFDNLEDDFVYEGGDLLIEVVTDAGGYRHSYFAGENQTSYTGYYSYLYYSDATAVGQKFLPKATFEFEANDTPVLTDPQDGDNVSFGPYEAPATNASTNITVKGRNLTEALSISVSGTGFHVSTNSVSAADANAGTTITVTYDGTDATATGTLTITSGNGEVSTVTVNLTSGYIAHDPVLTAPTSGSTIDVGTNTGLGASTTVTVTGNYLTDNLSVSVSGSGFRVTPETLSAEDVNDGTATITITYTGTNPNASGTLTISSGEVSVTVPLTASYSTGIEPVVHGMVRMGTLPIVDQFAEEIPPTNDHPYRYTYYLKLATRDTTSSPARVPAQHTGAVIEGYYSTTQMEADTDPTNFLKTDMLSAEVDMNLSPASAPYFYTVNSILNGVPESAEEWDSYLNVFQRREAGDYQEMQTAYTYDNANIPNPNKYKVYESGENSFVDYRDIQAESHTDYLSYVPIVWTKGIDRYYYTTDSLHNSYGAPLWEVHTGRVDIQKPSYERQAKNANGDWNPSVNWYDEDNNPCSLFMITDLHATGILPEGNIEYEPYMFRLWVKCDALRNMNQVDSVGAVNDPDASRTSPRLLYTKYCHGADDLTLDITKNDSIWSENITFGALNSIQDVNNPNKPTFLVRFYYVVKGHQKPLEPNRAEGDEDHVGYVVDEEVTPYDPTTAVIEMNTHGEIVEQMFYNIQGMQSSKPFDGINIVVTRYSDGTTSTVKVIK